MLIRGGALIPAESTVDAVRGCPSRNYLGQIVLSRLSPGQMDGGKDIFHPGLLGIKANGKKVLPGVIGYFHDPPESGDGGAHGVRAAASDKSALLYDARHPEIYTLALHEAFSVKPVHLTFRPHPARRAL